MLTAKEATIPEIRAAHRKRVLKCHPDKIQDESQRIAAQVFSPSDIIREKFIGLLDFLEFILGGNPLRLILDPSL
jgi:hypothetical protein